MQLCPLLIACSVLRFQKRLLQCLIRGLILMDCVAFLKHLVLDCELGCGFFMLGSFEGVYEFLGMFLLFAFGLKSLFDFRGKSRELGTGFCSKSDLDGKCGPLKMLKEGSEVPLIEENSEKSNLYPGSDENLANIDSDEKCDFNTNFVDDDDGDGDDKEFTEEVDSECDVTALREMVRSERHRANEALAELEKERAAAATAAEEAMAMILRLQSEKSSIELESTQYQRMAEEKQIHDQEVIRSLQWLLWRHEAEMEDDLESTGLKPKKLFHEFEEAEGTSLSNTQDDIDDVLCRSNDF